MDRRLPAGGNRIRTIGPAPAKGSSGRCQSETAARKAAPLTGSGPKRQCLPGVAAHSLSLRGGTASSNPSSSAGESTMGPETKPIEKPDVAAPRCALRLPAELAVSSSTTLGKQRSPRERGSDGKLFCPDAIIAPGLDSKRKYTQIIVSGRFALPGIGASFFKGEKTTEAEDRDRLFSEL